jgi:hypothetical protein
MDAGCGTNGLDQRLCWLRSCDRDLPSWFCTKYAKESYLSYFSHGRSCVLCLFQQYKANLKNVGKQQFDCKSSNNDAVESFFTWCIENDADTYLRENRTLLVIAHIKHKRRLYARYKSHPADAKSKATARAKKDRLMARDAVYNVKCTLVM